MTPSGAPSRQADRPLRRIFRWPLVLGVASLAGLLSALLGDGPWDALSWALLALPVAAGLGLAGWERRRQPTDV